MTIYYFAYGMNTCSSAMNYDSLAKPVGRATLAGFHLEFAYYATIAAGGSMQGVLWEIDDKTLKQLDKREGYPEFYTRFTSPVTIDATGKQVNAIIYQMTPEYSDAYSGYAIVSDHYLDMIRDGYSTFGISHDQINDAVNM
jgi:gamma-glutamylcyclotransferase (GGCT)/AIG2-like uncharacterized protein YtfP